MSGSDDLLLGLIRECIRTGRYAFTNHALTKHPPAEGFTPRQAIEAINNGSIVEHYAADCRCLVAGTASGLVVSKDFITTYIHCVVKYDDIRQVVVITMYRPSSDEWIGPFRRKPKPEGK